MRSPRRMLLVLSTAVGTAAALAAPAAGRVCNDSVPTPVPQPSTAQMVAAGLGKLPLGPLDRRVDLTAPAFSNPTDVTNPLFPISRLGSVVLNGEVDGKAFRTETTLLGETRVIEWNPGQCVKTLVSQYVAYLDGRIQEVALDFYAQADDGSVWYFGEDVYNYEDGVVADTSGTWLAGKEGPAAMIMPANPKVGDVNRPENIPGVVWEEVAVKETGKTVVGPLGPVTGAMVGTELHDDGSRSDKVFAPGYGEFYTAHEGDVEALALAVPRDALPGPAPAHLRTLSRGWRDGLRAAAHRRWRTAATAGRRMSRAWKRQRASGVPIRLAPTVTRGLGGFARAVDARQRARARGAALELGQAVLDLELRHRPPAEVDRDRFDLWARRTIVDAAVRDRPAVRGDVATLEWIRDRIARGLDPVAVTRLDTRLAELRANVSDDKLGAAARTALALLHGD